MSESPTPPAYRSSHISPAAGTMILPPQAASSTPRRLWNIAADLAALPRAALLPRTNAALLGHQIPLHYELRRWAWRTERCVEIALGHHALRIFGPHDTLEVGNVMPLAGAVGHTVVDKYEAGPGVINEDIVDFDPGRRFRLVLSLSTMEHVGWDEFPRDPAKAAAALERMSALVAEGGALLVTIPVGWHRKLEEAFVAPGAWFDSVTLLVKTSRRPRWERRPVQDASRISYGSPFACGNGILVGVRGEPLGQR